MEYRQLKYVLTVAEEQSFSQAAKKLYISQPSLSRCILTIEEKLGIQLFDRTISPLKLTYAGEYFVATAKRILDLNHQLSQRMSDIAHLKKGRLTIGSSPFRSTYLLPQVLPLFQSKFPGIEIVLEEGTTAELEEYALNGLTDFSISLLSSETLLTYEPLFTEELLLALSPQHPISKKSQATGDNQPPWPKIHLSELKDVPFIAMKQGQKLHHTLLDLCAQAGFKPRTILESQSMEAAQALVAAGFGATLLPDTLVKANPTTGHPCYFSVEPVPLRTVAIAYRKESYLSKAAQEFIAIMKETLSDKINS